LKRYLPRYVLPKEQINDIKSLRSGFLYIQFDFKKIVGFGRNFFYNTGEGEAEENKVSQPDKE